MHLEPAASVINELGGVAVVAERLKVDPTTVRRFRYAASNSGTGGFFPARYIFQLLLFSHELGRPLPLERFVLTPEQREHLAQSFPKTWTASSRKSEGFTP
ncbi:hypothetical protein [Roseibium alexandrii]|uniref:Uncharacterized protein n=1 Tax=Roseibium alexandrii (strain DSM 17067 / NCIMB 14079 / DFL-11) TaxID=244592 RepID=A0A5E8H110_ROSAD|nr:hypothetical protein [Roseibium alexandrii]EEE46129.1 hypothetical protein SADFL11_3418 [Roseibium alexandrii DFL-11]